MSLLNKKYHALYYSQLSLNGHLSMMLCGFRKLVRLIVLLSSFSLLETLFNNYYLMPGKTYFFTCSSDIVVYK